ncbi:MAG: non-ribosomal peptide synthetase, partial [Mycobacterium sp.]
TVTQLLASWHRRIGDIDVLMPGEGPELGEAGCAVSSGGFADRFADVAAANPDVIALSWSGGQLSYRELDAAVENMAVRLAALGVGPEVPAAVRVGRGPDYVVAMLAVLRVGGACVPLELDTPDDRVDVILRQTGATVVINEPMPPMPPMPGESRSSGPQIHLDQAAYIVFTSGTSGEPKGVIGTHRALLAYAQDHAERVLRPAASRLGRRLRVAHAWSFAFDAAWQPLAALLEGHSVQIIDERNRRDAEALTKILKAQRVDVLDTTPSMFGQLRTCGLLDDVPLAVLALGGEAVGPNAWTDIALACSSLDMDAFNCYGPTETTVEAVVAAISDHDSPMIGHPTRGMSAMVLDSRLRSVPDGAVGELYLAGEQLTRGYLHRPVETALRYVAMPGGRRMYRTGDLVRRHPGRALQFLCRADDQVKVRGYRVEPAEIEAVLKSHPGVDDARVVSDAGPTGPRLVAFVAGAAAVPELRAMLRERLPRFMMPHRIVLVDDIPLTSNGKPDDTLLRARHTGSTQLSVPETETEKLLAQVFLELLGESVTDVDADVLELGLDSISALSVVQAVRRRGVPLRARMIAECATVRELAAAVDASPQGGRGDAGGADGADGAESDQAIPLLPAGRWLYEYGDPRRLAQTTVLRLPAGVAVVQIQAMLNAVVAAHPILRCQLDRATMTMTRAR